MPGRGPAPRPTALKVIEGVRNSRINFAEPQPRSAPPEPPPDLAPQVREVWDYTLRELTVMGLAYAADRDVIVAYCNAVVTNRKANAVLANSPILIKGIHGNMVRNPALAVQRDSALILRGFAQEFGLSPSARSRIETKNGGADDEGANPFAGTG